MAASCMSAAQRIEWSNLTILEKKRLTECVNYAVSRQHCVLFTKEDDALRGMLLVWNLSTPCAVVLDTLAEVPLVAPVEPHTSINAERPPVRWIGANKFARRKGLQDDYSPLLER